MQFFRFQDAKNIACQMLRLGSSGGFQPDGLEETPGRGEYNIAIIGEQAINTNVTVDSVQAESNRSPPVYLGHAQVANDQTLATDCSSISPALGRG
jgi:hypothetical protein